MNKERRKELARILEALGPLETDLESLAEQERDAYDNMPEGLKNSENGQKAEAAAEALETAHSELSSLMEELRGLE
jgi:glutathione S-transferase